MGPLGTSGGREEVEWVVFLGQGCAKSKGGNGFGMMYGPDETQNDTKVMEFCFI